MKNHLFSVRALAREERQEFAELLDGLSPQQWQAARGQIDRLNESALRTAAGPDELRELMRAGVDPSGAGALYGCRVALIECLIHQQDIRRPLGLPRIIPADTLRASLTFARVSPVIGGAWPGAAGTLHLTRRYLPEGRHQAHSATLR
ncbi:hypothetical protein [Mycolicibacterium fortuitum]|uniref:hypothetical protein n=1 Tax=Mycolicibacterium fortuitum TaxID=1766 RepID=UPI001CE0B708|nr:hypothetical protein [Mycolicibacterium fortuitum]MCA4721833.1 hypothetical protein [Mycolicibacterium fortuitum]